jgi:hypothetical protein
VAHEVPKKGEDCEHEKRFEHRQHRFDRRLAPAFLFAAEKRQNDPALMA